MKFGLPISLTLHVLAAFGGLLLWSGHVEQLAQTNIVPLELVTVSAITDIAPTRSKDEKPEAKPDVEPDVEPEPVKPEVTPPPTIKPEPTPQPTSEPDKPTKPAAPAFDLDALEKAFDDARTDNPDEETQQVLTNENRNAEIADNARRGVGTETGSTVNALDYIRSRLHNCWIVDAGAVDFQNLVIDVRLLLNRDASISDITVINNAEIIASSNRAWAVARHNATTALRKCAPYDGLLSIDYNVWKELRLHLDPGEN